MADKTRSRGRPSSSALTGPALPAPAPAQAAATPLPEPEGMVPATIQTSDWDAKLALILERVEGLDEMKEALRRLEAVNKDLKEVMVLNQQNHQVEVRAHRITRQELAATRETNRRLEIQINGLYNHQKICNLRVDGLQEENNENLKKFVIDMAATMGQDTLTQNDIVSVYRLGKHKQQTAHTRPRTVLISFTTEKVRNSFFFARTTLKDKQQYKGVYVNDDVTQMTRRQRDDFRVIAAMARRDGIDVRVHTDGILLNGVKHLLTSPHTLPEEYSVSRARTVEIEGELYFSSEASFLSNFYPSAIVEGQLAHLSAEHMYQYLKCEHAQAPGKMAQILSAPSPLEAKHIADSVGTSPEWRKDRDAIMERVVAAKFDQNADLARMLVETGDMVLNEATNNDHFGIGVTVMAREIRDKSYRGSNKLGLILMNKRASLKMGGNAQAN